MEEVITQTVLEGNIKKEISIIHFQEISIMRKINLHNNWNTFNCSVSEQEA